MGQTKHGRSALGLVAFLMAGLLAWPAIGLAHLGGQLSVPSLSTTSTTPTVTGDAAAVRTTVLGLLGTATTTGLADTGTLSGVNDARDASMHTGTVPSSLPPEVLSPGTTRSPPEAHSALSL